MHRRAFLLGGGASVAAGAGYSIVGRGLLADRSESNTAISIVEVGPIPDGIDIEQLVTVADSEFGANAPGSISVTLTNTDSDAHLIGGASLASLPVLYSDENRRLMLVTPERDVTPTAPGEWIPDGPLYDPPMPDQITIQPGESKTQTLEVWSATKDLYLHPGRYHFSTELTQGMEDGEPVTSGLWWFDIELGEG